MPLIHNNLRTIVGAAFCVQLYMLLELYFKLPGVILWGIQISILTIFYRGIKKYQDPQIDRFGMILVYVFIGWMFFGFFRACSDASGYWMWKYVVRNLILSAFFIVILLSSNILFVRGVYRLFWRYFLPLILIAVLILKIPTSLNYLPYSTLLLFWGALPKRQRWILLGIVVFFFAINEQRNDIAKIIAAIITGISITYFYAIIPQKAFKVTRLCLLSAPLILLSLAVSGTFNVFKMDEYMKGDYKQQVKNADGELVEDNLKADTRTFLFQNVFYTMNKYDAWIMGRNTAWGDEGLIGGFMEEGKADTGYKGRYGNEVGILDILLWYGVIGVILYFLLYIRASYLAIYKSRNKYATGIGIYTAFLWCWAFIWEKPMFEFFFMIDLIMLGMCFSHSFRNMTDMEVKRWISDIFITPQTPRKKQNT